MKILTGALRGQQISFSPNPHLRPTADKVKKALFDTLRGALEDKRVLDLFSGTGALGFEALSCGAAEVVFVELNKAQSKKIVENLQRLRMEDRGRVLAQSALAAIEQLSKKGEYFDFIFLDPPYERGLAAEALEALSKSMLAGPDTILVIETRKRESLGRGEEAFRAVKEKKYGDTKVVFFKRR